MNWAQSKDSFCYLCIGRSNGGARDACPPLRSTLLAFTANSAAQSAQTHIQSAIVVIDTSNNA